MAYEGVRARPAPTHTQCGQSLTREILVQAGWPTVPVPPVWGGADWCGYNWDNHSLLPGGISRRCGSYPYWHEHSTVWRLIRNLHQAYSCTPIWKYGVCIHQQCTCMSKSSKARVPDSTSTTISREDNALVPWLDQGSQPYKPCSLGLVLNRTA